MASSTIRDAEPGLVEIAGTATGRQTIVAPIQGKPCYLYRATAWQQTKNEDGADKQGAERWEKIADETLHLPFLVHDATGELLVEPLGADLGLHPDFREEYDAALSASNATDGVPPRVSAFVSRHGIVPSGRLRIEESLVEAGDEIFVAGTLAENPGIELRPFAPGNDSPSEDSARGPVQNSARDTDWQPTSSSHHAPAAAPQVIRLSSGSPPTTARQMSQQGKIAAALVRAGIAKPEAWSAAGVPYQHVAVAGKDGQGHSESDSPLDPTSESEKQFESSSSHLAAPMVLMKGEHDATFVISTGSQKELARRLAWKSAGMLLAGAVFALLGLFVLLLQTKLP